MGDDDEQEVGHGLDQATISNLLLLRTEDLARLTNEVNVLSKECKAHDPVQGQAEPLTTIGESERRRTGQQTTIFHALGIRGPKYATQTMTRLC